ncbi:aldehyde dehydrogenase (NADP(+)) [Labilibaculum manganireducens]|nr:aldehyde dehydrogenase (NADP(+)) [Labilibaculum manganireducens]
MSRLQTNISNTMEAAGRAFKVYKKLSGRERAKFLRLIGKEIYAIGDDLIHTVMEETNLPEGRVRGERDRTVGQIDKFADLLDEGSWLNAVIDAGDVERSPLPKPDLRKLHVPIGPVVVFGAGNFPLAFSVAGGDTASALAGGNSVVVKGHPAHPKTGALIANAIKQAVKKSGLPEGVFGFIEDSGYESGELLVKNPLTKAVGFTGSERGGRALYNLAAGRPEPIPVFAEMGSVNPVVVLPNALKNDHASIASKLVASVNMGAGQFCTNPGLLITTKSDGFDDFIENLVHEVKNTEGAEMYSESILRNYQLGTDKILSHSEIKVLGKSGSTTGPEKAVPVLGLVKATDFIAKPSMHEEVFGPFSLLVVCESAEQIIDVIEALKGQLTTTLWSYEDELDNYSGLISSLVEKCGRLLLNGVPTGVEVCSAMQHGGPYPASTDSRFTSVGVSAILRFVRPVSYQDFPQHLLPEELKNTNPLGIWRLVDNQWTKDPIK